MRALNIEWLDRRAFEQQASASSQQLCAQVSCWYCWAMRFVNANLMTLIGYHSFVTESAYMHHHLLICMLRGAKLLVAIIITA